MPNIIGAQQWIPNLAGITTDFKALGSGSQDPQTGIIGYSADFGTAQLATCRINGGNIEFAMTDDGGDISAILVKEMFDAGLPNLRSAASIFAYLDLNMATLGGTNLTAIQIWIANQDFFNVVPDEYAIASFQFDGANRDVNVGSRRNNVLAQVTSGNAANWANAGRLWVRQHSGTVTGGFTEPTGPSSTSPVRATFDDWHARSEGAGSPYLVIRIIARAGGGDVSGVISGLGAKMP